MNGLKKIVIALLGFALLVGAVSATNLDLVSKDANDDWNPTTWGSGTLHYTCIGAEFTFHGEGLADGEYALINYDDPWGGSNTILGTDKAVGNGIVNINGVMPSLVVSTGFSGSKIWLVPVSDLTADGTFTAWNPDTYLFETELINVPETCDAIAAPEFPTVALPAAMIVGVIGAVLFIRKADN